MFEEHHFSDTPFTLVIADIDYLHNVNKLQGWKAGNELIESVANQLRDLFAPHQIYRIGGDEFCMVVRECSKSYEKIIKQMNTVDNISYKAMDSNGYVSPCCILGDVERNEPKQLIKDYKKINLHHTDLRTILEGEFFRDISDGINGGEKRLRGCYHACGVK